MDKNNYLRELSRANHNLVLAWYVSRTLPIQNMYGNIKWEQVGHWGSAPTYLLINLICLLLHKRNSVIKNSLTLDCLPV